MKLGPFDIVSVSGGRFQIDGGAMFGVVPKTLWQRVVEVDDRNRIVLDTRCLVIQNRGQVILVDSGYGTKWDPKVTAIYDLDNTDVLLDNLAACDIYPDQVDMVIMTHLHFDHAGGLTRRDKCGQLIPTFPQARHVIQRTEWEMAMASPVELGDAYYLEDLAPLEQNQLIELIEGDVEIVPGVHSILTGGHTNGHQAIYIESDRQRVLYPSDLCPTHHHLHSMWCTAFDVEPLVTRRRKTELLGQAADAGWLIVWEHDSMLAAGTVRHDSRRGFVVDEQRCL